LSDVTGNDLLATGAKPNVTARRQTQTEAKSIMVDRDELIFEDF
jgi:hypothetical protein